MATDNISKFYQAFNAKYDNFNNEQEFRDFLKGAKRENIDNLYNAFNNAYDNFGSADDMISYLGWSDSAGKQQAEPQQAAPRRSLNVSRNPSVEQAYQQMMAPKPEEKPVEQPQAQPQPQPAPAPVEETTAQEPEVNPFPYSGGLEEEQQEIAALRETVAEDAAFVEEYEKRRDADRKRNQMVSGVNPLAGAANRGADAKWLKENEARYKEAKSNVAKVEREVSGTENAIAASENKIAQRKNREEMASPQEIIATGRTAFGRDNAGRTDSEHELRKAADELYASADKEYDKSSKYQEGYEGNAMEQLWTGVKDFVADAGNNFDSGSLTFGLSKGHALTKAREVGDKYNSIIDGTLKDMGMSDDGIKSVLSSIEENGAKLQSLEEELQTSSAEIDAMADTYEDMARRGDPDAEAYGRDLQKKIDAYNKRINEEYKPTWDKYDSDRKAYEDVMAAIDAAVESGMTGGEKALLDALEKFTQAKTLRSDDVSVAGKAGAGAEQSAEFMLDFILTGGISKAGTKVATKIATNRALKKYGAEALKELAAKGKTISPGLGLRMATDAATTLGRMAVMSPRTLQAYGENLTEYSGKDEAGRIDFDRSQANALANSLLSQYIEYWSEGFGEYFGEAEQALFRSVTKKAPAEAIGKTLKGYRGSIGQYLDKGKFDGMFNEMLEEVVGSTFNALTGWMSGDRVGDAGAMKEFFAGENLATLALSFLPMSAIGAATNMSAYHKMKERYDKGAEAMDRFVKSGAISQEELQQLAKDIPELTPAEVKDKIVDITDRARKANGGRLPSDFTQNLLGYLEGEFAMGLRYDEWEDSQEKMSVVNAYTASYTNPDARASWDLNNNEQAARQAAVDAGFTEEELDNDSYMLAQEAFEIKGTQPERADALMNYASAKAAAEGLRRGYTEQTQQVSEIFDERIRGNVDTNGTVTTAAIMLNGKPRTVFITQEDASVDANGNLTTPTGPDGVVRYRLNEMDKEGKTAPASQFSNVQSTDTTQFIDDWQNNFQRSRAAYYEAAQNTVSPTGQAQAISEKVGQSVVVTDHNGVYQPFKVERMTNGGTNVVLSGDKKALQGVAEAMGMRVPTSGYLEAPVTSLYPILAKEEDGSLTAGPDEKTEQEAPAAPAEEQAADLGDLRDQTVPIFDEGQVRNAHVIDTSDGSVVFEELDENGDVMRTVRLPEADFARAMQEAANPTPAAEETVAAEEAPAEEPAAPAIPVDEKGRKVYDAPGVAVEDAIADLYSTPGLTEEQVDQYIAQQAAKAEAARNPEMGDMTPEEWGQATMEAARVADFWSAVQQAAQARKQQPEAPAQEEATPAKQRPAPEAPVDMSIDSRRRVVSRLKNWARRTGVKVNIVRNVDEVKDVAAKKALKEGRALAGWFNEKTGEVEVFLPNVPNVTEADKTFIHETVAHKGLLGLLGRDGYNELCDRVWNELMTPEEQAEFLYYNRHLQGSEEYLRRAAADEYIARLSENLDMPDKRNIFERIIDWIMDRLGLGGNVADIEKGAAEKATAEGAITRSDLYDLLEDSLKRFEKGRKKLNTESLPAEIQNEMQAKGLVMDGGAVMDEQQGELKKATGYQTPNELDMESSPEVGNVRFSESTMPAWARNYMTYADAKRHVVQVLENFVRDVAADELVHGMVPTGVYKYGEKSSGSFSGPLRTNIEYIVTFDMDTSCPRSLQYLEYVNQIEARIGRPLTQRESVQLIEMMRMYGQMIPCVYCYCENKRQALKQYYTDFMRARTGVINAKTEEEALAAMYGHNTTAEAQESNDPAVVLTPAAYEVFKKWRQEKDYNPTIEQLWYQYKNDRNVILTVLDNMLDSGAVSTDLSDQKITNALCKDLGITGTEANGAVRDIVSEWKWDRIEDRRHNNFTRIEDEDDLVVDNRTLTLWREMTSYGKSASGAKNVLRYVPYTDELKDLSQEQRDFINGLGGLRMHSSNDFRIDYVLDYFQFMADMAVNHMFGHTYTKSPEFVRIFGNSGYKINMSIAAYEDSRGIRPNADEGFDWTTARELREAFPNAGVMLMATSDAQIQFALDNDWIDMCIPFHHSGLPKAIWYEMRAWSDYSSTQNEKFLNATEMREALKADGVAVPNKLTAAAVEKMYIDHFNIKILRGKDGKRMRPHFLPGPTPKDGVIIPGHNNDYDTYIRLCREYGVHPRFYGIKVKDNTPEGGGREVDITEHPGYMKFIKETARTDSPQTAIEFNFDQPSEALGGRSPIEYALEELKARAQAESEMAGGPVRNIYESYKQDPYGIVPQFINGVINHEEEYRKTHNGEELPLDYLTPDSRKWFMTERKALESAYKDFDTIPYHPHEYDENGNLIMTDAEGQPETDAEMVAEEEVANTMFREVTDPATIEWFNNAPKTTGFRTVVKKAEDTYGSPMAGNLGQVKGKKKAATSSFMRNVIEQAEENPDIADENGKVKLIKPKREDGKKLTDVGSVDYNPYIHLRLDKINRQFKDAWKRDDLIYIESEVPVEEVPDFRGEKTPDYSKSPYHAEKAALPVGIHDWNGGALMLSRYDRPFREVPWEEVADAWAADEDFQKNGVHFDIVPPQMRDLLTERGIEIIPPHNGMGQDCFDAYNEWKGEKNGPDDGGTRFREAVTPEQDAEYMAAVEAGDTEKAQKMVDAAAYAAGYTIHAYHGTDSEDGEMPFTVFKGGHFTDDYGFASYYNDEYIYDVYIKMDNPLEYDFKGQNSDWALDENGNRITTHRVFDRAIEEGYDGVILTNVDEYGAGIEEEDGEYPGSVTDYIPATPNQIKSAEAITRDANGNVVPLSERFNEKNPDIRFREANRNQLGFISNADAALDRIKMDKATPEQWVKMLEKEGGLKAGEDKWLGLSDWLKSQDRKSITKDEIADYIDEHRIVLAEADYMDAENLPYGGTAKWNDYVANEFGADVLDAFNFYEGDGGTSFDFRDEDKAAEVYKRLQKEFGLDHEIETEPGGEYTREDMRAMHKLADEIATYADSMVIDANPINSIRIGYTTEGLDNKREIALVVPTIESWNEGDQIHFGDAGNGRAVAWVRFGDTLAANEGEKAANEKHREAARALNAYREELIAKYALKTTGSKRYTDLATPEEMEKLKSLKEEEHRLYEEWDNLNATPKRVLVIDEIQSKRHQEAREQGGYKDDSAMKKAEAKMDAAQDEYDKYTQGLIEKYGGFNEMRGKLTPEENAESQRLYTAYQYARIAFNRNGFDPMEDEEYRRLVAEQQAHENSPEFQQLMGEWRDAMKAGDADRVAEIQLRLNPFQLENQRLIHKIEDREAELADEFRMTHKSRIPAAPFEKNWHELAMKRMLRLAAEEGYDYVAWTTGNQQAERYNIGDKVDWIQRGNDFGQFPESVFIKMGDKVNSVEVDENGTIVDSTRALSDTVGKPLSDLLGKELAEKVMSATPGKEGRMDSEDLRVGGEGMKGFYDDILPRFMNKYGKKWGVKVQDITLPNVEEAGRVMHAVPVTQEMKDSVMQGQTMFRERITPEQDKEYMDAVEAGDMEKAGRMVRDAFKAAFPDTKVVDENGDPKIMYHAGTFGVKNGRTVPNGWMHFGTKKAALDRFVGKVNSWFYVVDGSKQRPDGKYVWDIDDFVYTVGEDSPEGKLYEKLRSEQPGYDTPYEALMAGEDALGILRPEYKEIVDGIRNGEINDSAWREMDYALTPVYLNITNPERVEDQGDEWDYIDYDRSADGLVYENEYEDEGSDSYIAFRPSQVKLADPVTYDDNGNVIPLSERFNPENNDIRFREAPTEVQQKEARIANAERQATEVTLDRMGEQLGVKINRVTRDGMPTGHKTDKGYYDPETDEMTICMDNVTDERDAIATVLHETVGHKGLRELFGDRFREAMANIYASLDREGREWVNAYITRHNLGFGEDGIIRGMEEYMSHLAESGNYKTSVWERIKEILGKVVDLVFGTNGFVFTDRELNYILRASYEHLKNPEWLDTPLGRAQDTLMKRELGINESDPNKPTDPDGPRTGLLFRDGSTGVASADYERDMNLWHTAAVMENQNGDLPVKYGMERILQEMYGDQWEEKMKNLPDDEDYLTRHNIASSRAETEAHNFELFHFTPLLEQVREIQSRLMGDKKGKEERQLAYERIIDYMYAVSGLERNAWKNAQVDPAEQRDWSGITSLMGRPKEEWQEAEADARAMIDAFRAEIGDDAVLDELWNRVRSCTDFSLEHAYKYGLLTREEFERLHGTSSRPRLWNYYLPLRGFAEETAEDLFDYASYMGSSDGSAKTLEKAKGRWTEADNPLAYILRIAEAEIVQGNDNWAKQALYRFTLANDGNSLLAQTEPWYVKDPGTGKWVIAEPLDIDPSTGKPETLEDFEARMQALRAADPKAAKKGRRGLKLDQIMANKGNRNQHMIRLKVGGVDKRIWVNGDPSLAKAVNGWGRAKNMQWLRRAGRVLSNLFTTYSIDFTAKNLIRDTIYSRVALMMKEDSAYRHRFSKNWWSNFGYGAFAFPMVRLAARWESGELQRKPAAARTEKEQMFIDFMTDGGQTGYTLINSINEIKRRLERSMRRSGKDVSRVTIPILGHYAEFVKTLNEGFELLTRFTAYQTSRQMGRSGQRSASDAKEISVNFNRRGAQSGEGIWGNIASYLGATHYFYNAGVQGFDNFLRLFKASPVKMSVTTVGLAMMGILTPMINSMLAGALAGAGGDGDGDDDWYWNVPEWVRRNNIIIGAGNWYLAVPLPVEFRSAYGLGDIAGAAFCYQKTPNRTFGGVTGDMLATAANILPVNPIEGYSGSGNLGDALIRGVFPDAGVFFVDWATNRDYTGRALWKENPFNDTVPKSQGAFASTPKGIIRACQGLAQISGGKIDVAPGLVRDFMNNYGGGFFRAAEDVSKIITGAIGNDPDRPFRWDNIPFFSGFTGHIDKDRSNSFAQGALREYQDLSEGNVKTLNAICNTDELTAAKVYGDPEDIPEEYRARVNAWKALHPKEYELGKMYREGMNNQYKMKQYVRGEKKGQWYKSNEVERKGVNTLKKEWKDLREMWLSMPENTPEEKAEKAEMDLMVQEAWHLYYNAEADLADKLMDFEYGK